MKWVKYIAGTVGAVIAGFVLMIGATKIVYPAISEMVGLSVAQSSTLWNSVADAAKGDALSSGILAQSPYLWNGLTFDRQRGSITFGALVDVTRISGSITPADAYANPTTANQMWSLNGLFNGTTWDRQREPTADALAVTGLSASAGQAFNGGSWDRIRTATADALASTGIQTGNPSLFNGATFDRQDGISNTNNIATTSIGTAYTTQLATWGLTNTQAGAVQATASKAAGGGTVRHVVVHMSACLGGTSAQAPVLLNLRDGATGAGTILRSWLIGVGMANDSRCVDVGGLNITGSANTAMTIEFAAAGNATSTATVNLSGYSTP